MIMSSRHVFAILSCLATLPLMLRAEERGMGHYMPGMISSFIDMGPYDEKLIYKNMTLYYGGEAGGSKSFPLGLNIASGVEADLYANISLLAYQTDWELFGARYMAAIGIPYVRADVEVSGTLTRNPRRPGYIIPVDGPTTRSKTISDSCEGLGDIILAPLNLVWKTGDFTYDAHVYVYAPTGVYDEHDLANIGMNYWTFEPGVDVSWLSSKIGTEVTLAASYDISIENQDTDYRTGDSVHLESTVAQHLPLFGGFAGVGVNAFYFQQVTADSGAPDMIGDFKGMTMGIGPVISYVIKAGGADIAIELKWLPELDTENRLEGDYIWLKAAVAF
jgi:hypothetical protein